MTQVTVNVVQAGESASEARVRAHKVLIDRPEAKGGTDKGAMGGELLLVSLGGCFMSNLLAAIKSRGIEASAMTAVVTGTLESVPPRFSSIEMKVSGSYPDREAMQKLLTMAEKGCIVSNTLRGAVKLTVFLEEV